MFQLPVYACLYVGVCAHDYRCLQRFKKGTEYSRTGVTGSCEIINMVLRIEPGSSERTCISLPLRHLTRPLPLLPFIKKSILKQSYKIA